MGSKRQKKYLIQPKRVADDDCYAYKDVSMANMADAFSNTSLL